MSGLDEVKVKKILVPGTEIVPAYWAGHNQDGEIVCWLKQNSDDIKYRNFDLIIAKDYQEFKKEMLDDIIGIQAITPYMSVFKDEKFVTYVVDEMRKAFRLTGWMVQ